MYQHGGSRGRGDIGRGRGAQNPSPGFRVSSGGGISLEMVEAAVAKAKNDLLSAGGNVSTWKVAQSACVYLQISSWDSLGVRFNDVPTLRNLQFVEGKVWYCHMKAQFSSSFMLFLKKIIFIVNQNRPNEGET